MRDGRISINIGSDVKKLAKLLRSASDDREVLMRLVKQPIAEFAKAGINLERYYSSAADKRRIIEDINSMVRGVIGGEVAKRMRAIVAETSYSRNTDTSYEYNFDNTSSTDYKYELHAGTTRGTFSETSTGEATDTNTGFNGLGLREFRDLMVGPLISNKAMELITSQFQKTVGAGRRMR